ncbi:MAG: flagellar hook-associated protein FlgL [Clostridia bacterium]|nr:flagellar hook-associated protein FlgL [Clostridia bacterium]
MRVTESLRGSQLLLDLQQAEQRLIRSQNQIASGKRVSLPEDDPVAAAEGMRFGAELARDQRVARTAQAAGGWLQATDTALASVGDILLRARELALEGASDSLPPESRQALAKEVDQLRQQLIQVGNSQFAGRYLFGGVQASGNVAPFTASGTYQGSTTPIAVDLTGSGLDPSGAVPAAAFTLSVTGDQLMRTGDPTYTTAVAVLQQLESQLQAPGAGATAVAGLIPALDGAVNNVLELRATVGSRLNRVQDVQSRLGSDQLLLQQEKAQATDVDMTRAAVDFNVAQYAYQAALAVGARVVQPSLVDYLR